MSVGILTLKIGLVATVTGASIATPILFNRGFGGSSAIAQDSRVEGLGGQGTGEESRPDSENVASSEVQQRENQITDLGTQDSHEGSTVSETSADNSRREEDVTGVDSEGESVGQVAREENTLQRSGVSGDALSQASSSINETSQPVTTELEDFDKKCFIVPADSINNDGVELLTCYTDQKIDENVEENDEERDSLFHIYDKSKLGNPLEIDESLMWSPSEQQLTARLAEKTGFSSEYTFKAKGNYWGGISDTKQNLMDPNECVIYKATLNGVKINSTHLLTCGNDSSDYGPDNPKGIPLTDWIKRNN